MAKSYERGHEISIEGKEWIYTDTKEPVSGNQRPCGYCSKPDRADGHDACLGGLQGLMNACCGHGETNKAYVQFLDGNTVHGSDAIIIMAILKKSNY